MRNRAEKVSRFFGPSLNSMDQTAWTLEPYPLTGPCTINSKISLKSFFASFKKFWSSRSDLLSTRKNIDFWIILEFLNVSKFARGQIRPTLQFLREVLIPSTCVKNFQRL